MKTKNIVKDTKKKTPFYREKRGVLVVIFILLLFFLTALTMPMSQIPFLGRMGAFFGLTDDSMRSLTLSDFAAYTFGVKDGGRLASVRGSQYSVYESSGGLSPFSVQKGDRLIDAKQAYLKEFDKTGRWNSINGSAYGKNIEDPEGIGLSAKYLGGNVVAPTIDAGTPNVDEFGRPFVPALETMSLEDAYANSSVTRTDASGNMVLSGSERTKFIKQKGSEGAIKSARSDENNIYFQALNKEAAKLNGGRLGAMGGINAITSRMRTNIGATRQLGAFGESGKDMGRAYYLSAMATGQKYQDVAKSVAEAAFDGGEIESEDLIAPGEETQKVVSSLEPPSNIVNKANAAINACAAAKAAHKAKMEAFAQSFKEQKKALFEDASYEGNPPGSCRRIFNPTVYSKRQAWNGLVDSMVSECESMRGQADQYAGKCGLNYSQTVSCSTLQGLKLGQMGSWSYWAFWSWVRRCKREVKTEAYGTLSPSAAKNKTEEVIESIVNGAGLDGTVNENFF